MDKPNNWNEPLDIENYIDGPDYDIQFDYVELDKKIEPVNFVVSIGDTCASANLIRWNNARTMESWNSFIFDWAQSNIECVIDVIENGLKWHIENNINNHKVYDVSGYTKLYYPHHDNRIDWQILCAERFFKLLESNYNIIFLYMTTNILPIDRLNKMIEILIKKYKIKFKVVAATSIIQEKDYSNKIFYKNINEYLDTYECQVIQTFQGFKRKDKSKFYTNLFNILIPYKLDIKNI